MKIDPQQILTLANEYKKNMIWLAKVGGQEYPSLYSYCVSYLYPDKTKDYNVNYVMDIVFAVASLLVDEGWKLQFSRDFPAFFPVDLRDTFKVDIFIANLKNDSK